MFFMFIWVHHSFANLRLAMFVAGKSNLLFSFLFSIFAFFSVRFFGLNGFA